MNSNTQKPFDPTKPAQFRDPSKGEVLQILATDLSGDYPIAVKVKDPKGSIEIWRFNKEGRFNITAGGPYDLINTPVKHKGWIVIFGIGGGAGGASDIIAYTSHVFRDEQYAKDYARQVGDRLIKIIPIEWPEQL